MDRPSHDAPPSFLEIADAHARLAERFFEHQEALLARDFERAFALLVEYRKELLEHMTLEERELIPIYRRGDAPPNGKVEFFEHEHRKLLEFLDQARVLLERCRTLDGREQSRGLLELLDKETQIKNFAEHHEAREEKILFPALDDLANDEEKTRLVALFRDRDGLE